jgi:hypothetical protein
VLADDVLGHRAPGGFRRRKMKDSEREIGSEDRAFAGDGASVRHLAYAKYTPPKWATWPMPRTLQTNIIPGVDART